MEKDLPKGWIETTLGEISEWSSGGTPKRGVTQYYGGSIPWIKTGDLNDGIVNDVKEFLTEEGVSKSSAKVFPKGSVGIAMYGATIGKTGVWGMDAATNQACAVAMPYLNMNEFLHLFLKSEKQNFIDKGKGGAQPNISQTVIKAHKIKLPPLQEQKRIVAKLDTLFASLENTKARLEKIPILIKNFKQAILTQAVTGKLTEDINKGKVYVHNKLDNFCESSFYGPRFSKEDYADSGYATVRTTDMTDDGFLSIKPDTPRIHIADAKKLELYRVNEGDLLITRTGSIGKMARYKGDEIVIPSAYLIRFRFTNKVLTDFIYYCLTSPYGQQVMGLSAIALTQPNLNAKKIRDIDIPLVSIKEQTEIVRRVESLFAKADAIEAQYTKLKKKIDTLPQAILAKAFRGELVEQNPLDEPASVLLEKIQSLRQAQGSAKSKKKVVRKKKSVNQ